MNTHAQPPSAQGTIQVPLEDALIQDAALRLSTIASIREVKQQLLREQARTAELARELADNRQKERAACKRESELNRALDMRQAEIRALDERLAAVDGERLLLRAYIDRIRSSRLLRRFLPLPPGPVSVQPAPIASLASIEPFPEAEPSIPDATGASSAEIRWADNMTRGTAASYKEVWDRQAADMETAKLAVAGYADEEEFRDSAKDILALLHALVGINRHDIVLEIGCGVGRVGAPLSELCHHWIGCDISGSMLRHAAERLADRTNVTFIELSEVGLQEIPDNSIDLVYCTVVFMHLREWDRFRYVQEAFRVLRPGGRCYFDNVDITSALGWSVLEAGAKFRPEDRPAHLSMISTVDELRTYASRAGFESVTIHHVLNGWLALTGRKAQTPLV